jgi:hypothetical protein
VRAAATQRQSLALIAVLASVLTTLAALSTLLPALTWLVLAALLLLAGLLLSALLSTAALLRVGLVLLLVATRFVLAWIVRHWRFSSYLDGFPKGPSRPGSSMRGEAFCSVRGGTNCSQLLEK